MAAMLRQAGLRTAHGLRALQGLKSRSGLLVPGGSSPPPGYTTGAVSLDGGTLLQNLMLACTDNSVFSSAVWMWIPEDGTAAEQFRPIYAADPANTGWNDCLQGIASADDLSLGFGNGDNSVNMAWTTGSIGRGVWRNVLWTGDLSGTPTISALVNGGINGAVENITGTDGVFDLNGLAFAIGGDTFGSFFTGYLADMWIAPGQALDLSDPAVVAKFIKDGKPVDLGSDGSTPTGTAPAIFLHIDSGGNPMDFRTNKGTGGNFSLFGEATTTGALVSGSADVIVADTTGITAGVRVYATGVPGGTTVLSIDGGLSTVTMSAQASTTNPTADMQFGGVLQLAPSSPSD